MSRVVLLMRKVRKAGAAARNTPDVGDFDDRWLAQHGRTVSGGGPSSHLLARLKLVSALVADEATVRAAGGGAGPEPHGDALAGDVHRLLWRGEAGEIRSCAIRHELIVGRDSRCDLVLASPRLSRRHCALSVKGGAVELRDLGSVNGTWRNGRRLSAPEFLRDGDVVEVGGRTIAYVRAAGA